MARIKTMTRKNAMLHFMKFHDRHRNLARNKQRQSDPSEKRAEFACELDKLFDIGAPDAIAEIQHNRLLSKVKKEEDIRFYLDQRNERQGHMSGHDKVFERKAHNQGMRQERTQHSPPVYTVHRSGYTRTTRYM